MPCKNCRGLVPVDKWGLCEKCDAYYHAIDVRDGLIPGTHHWEPAKPKKGQRKGAE